MDIGNKIQAIRTENGMTQAEFAEKFNVTRQSVSNWENNKHYPDLDTLTGKTISTIPIWTPYARSVMNTMYRLISCLKRIENMFLVLIKLQIRQSKQREDLRC